MSNEVYREEILTALTPPKQLHVREIADFTAGRDDRVVTRKYVLLDEYERLARELEEERELHLTARGQSDAYEMGMESWKGGYERLRAALEKIATDEPLAACTVGCNEIAEIAREALS